MRATPGRALQGLGVPAQLSGPGADHPLAPPAEDGPMSTSPSAGRLQVREFLERLAEREAAAQAEAVRLREQITELSQQLSAAEDVLSRLHITRETILEMTGESSETASGILALSPVYRQILAIVEQAPGGLRVKDICRMLNPDVDHKHTESLPAKLKRMAARGILTEPEPGLFTLPQPGHDA
ncbi:hypothetical protein ACFLIM_09675 [Nonomuraea sp. M3C6]|uniref:Uncharacterized protein n=1 Tax=Nonomuraea marmarensis TaxID=3351344 RepID=A0ABW7A7W8_9ACTN